VDSECDRRTFLKSSLVVSTGLGLTTSGVLAKTAATQQSPMPLPKRPLGNAGREVTVGGKVKLYNV